MIQKLPQLIIMLSGVVLIAVGLYFVWDQVALETHAARLASQPVDPQSQHIMIDPSQGVNLSTRFVGLEIVVVGAVLEIVGFLGLKPWTGKS